jgi:hypothetical protein
VFYLPTGGEDADLVAADDSTELFRVEPAPLVVGIGTQEYDLVSYTVVVEHHRVRAADTETRVLDQ